MYLSRRGATCRTQAATKARPLDGPSVAYIAPRFKPAASAGSAILQMRFAVLYYIAFSTLHSLQPQLYTEGVSSLRALTSCRVLDGKGNILWKPKRNLTCRTRPRLTSSARWSDLAPTTVARAKSSR